MSRIVDIDAVAARILELKQSPVATMSLSSKELFHSNLLGFLLEKYPPLAEALFGQSGKTATSCGQFFPEYQIHREKNNIDLMIGPEKSPYLILENKVKSIPNKEQLIEYGKRYPSARKYLLTLIEPPFSEIEPPFSEAESRWIRLSYETVATELRQLVPLDANCSHWHYHRLLIEDYCKLLSVLLDIKSIAEINDNNQHEPFFFAKTLENTLRETRLWDLAQKIRYASFVQFFLKRIGQADFNQLTLETSAGITRSVGFADFILKPAGEQEKTYGIGIQIQGYQYRYLVENKNGDATPLAKQLFEAGNLMGCTTHPHPKIGERLRFNQFGANFKYRYRNIGPSATTDTQTPHSLATQILEDLSRIAANAMQQIAIAEKAGSAQ